MSREKARGTAFESLVVNYLKENGYPHARRNPAAGSKDVGDIGGLPLVLECKNRARMALAEWVDEAHREAVNAAAKATVLDGHHRETEGFAVIHKRRGKGRAGDQYVTLPLWVFVGLLP